MSLEERVAKLEAFVEIMSLEGDYARTWDGGDGEGWANLFTEDGVFELAASGDRPAQRYEGRAALRTFCEEIDAIWRGLHLLHIPSITLDGSTARGRVHGEWTAVGHGAANMNEQRRAVPYYDVTYERTPEGWRMQHRLERSFGGSNSDLPRLERP